MTTDKMVKLGLVAEYIENEEGIDWSDIERLYHQFHYPNAIMFYSPYSDMYHTFHVDRANGVTKYSLTYYNYELDRLVAC